MAVYKGNKENRVTKDGLTFSPRPSQAIINHSPDGFSWGYPGSGPAQLALALLYDVTGDVAFSDTYHQVFKWDYVTGWGEAWKITSEEIKEWVASVKRKWAAVDKRGVCGRQL